MSLDRPEQIVAEKRLKRADEEWRSFVHQLPEREREVVLLLVAHLDACPVTEA